MKIVRILYTGIIVIFTTIAGVLMFLSACLHCETAIYAFEGKKSLVSHTPYIYIGVAAFIVLLGIGGYILLERVFSRCSKPERVSRWIFIGGFILLLVEGGFWLCFYDSIPVLDQMDVYKEAQRMAGIEGVQSDLTYLMEFPRNQGIALLMAGLIKIFGDSFLPFRFLNLGALLLIYVSMCLAVEQIYQNRMISAMTSLVMVLFYPLIGYITFLYGTLLSVAFTSLGLYAFLKLIQSEKLRYGILAAVAFAIGILMHQSAAIGLIAGVIYVLLNIKSKKNVLRAAVVCVVCLGAVVGLQKTVDNIYLHVSGVEEEGIPMPAVCTIYMGLTAENGEAGPGSQDGSQAVIFEENNYNRVATNRDAAERIGQVLGEYVSGKRDWHFFLKKAEYQWLDPTFGARKITRINDVGNGEPANSEAFSAFYNSSFRDVLFKLSVGGMIAVYAGAFLSGIWAMKKKILCIEVILPQLYVIGGFFFQMMWESLSRYCLGYYIWMIPGTVGAVYTVYRLILENKIRRGK